ncbi:MAG: hypothetical protein JWN77_3227 [Frankiales bacterium]|jgi:hypothetical protein|nr:hypothetical protein [Frankiales bacterium]
MDAPAHGLGSVSRTATGYVATCLCGWRSGVRMTTADALNAQREHDVVVPYPVLAG